MYPTNKFNKVCLLFCLAPISSNSSTQLLLSAYSWATIICLVLVTINSFNYDVYGNGFILSSLVTSGVFLAIITGHIVAIVESLVKRDEHHKFFLKLQEVDDIFRFKLRHKILTQRLHRRILRKYCILSLALLLAILLFTGSVISRDYKGFYWHSIISLIVSRMRVIQAAIYVELVNYRLENLNLLLEQIQYCGLPQRDIILDMDYSELDSPRRIYVLKSVYAKIHDIVYCMNDIFGWSMLTFLLYFCLNFTYYCYWIFLILERYIGGFPKSEVLAESFSMGILPLLYCATCYECMNKSVATKKLVTQLFLRSSVDRRNDLLCEFILQIHHLPIVIHVRTFFTADLRLLSSICAAILGFLVFLIQFQDLKNEL